MGKLRPLRLALFLPGDLGQGLCLYSGAGSDTVVLASLNKEAIIGNK